MAVYSIRVVGVCSGGEHITLNLRRDESIVKQIEVTKTDLLGLDISIDEVIMFLIRKAIKNAGATTLAQAKTAVEAAEWVV